MKVLFSAVFTKASTNYAQADGFERLGHEVIRFPLRDIAPQIGWSATCDKLLDIVQKEKPDVVIERMVKEVVSGRLKSCGCFHSERASEACRKRVTTHGESATTLYRRWRTIHSRCENPNVPSYKDYGARGIYVCDEWKKFEPFRDWALANGYKKGLQIDRKDNDGPYSPNNCHFVTRSVNGNNKRNNVKVTAFGEEKNLAQWARDPRCLIPEQILRVRIWAGWEPERAMTTLSRRQSHKYSNEQKSPN
jgi:hypothetical protein